MKIYNLLLIGAVTLSLASCSNNKNAGETADQAAEAAKEVVDKAQEASVVTEIEDDGTFPASDNKLRVIDFNATWCGPCRQFAPNFHAVAAKYASQANFYSVDVDKNPALAQTYNVQSIPTVVYLKPDGTYTTSLGYLSEADFDAQVANALK